MTYIKFKGPGAERNLIKAILSSSQASLPGKNFPRVSVIGRTKIHPDIDILQIKDKKLIGFEVKVLGFLKGNQKKGWGWEEFYKGIGQAFHYLQFGLDQCGLALGFRENVPNGEIDKFCKELKKKSSLLAQILGKYFNLGIFRWEGGGFDEIVKAKGDFHYSGSGDKLYGEEISERMKNFRNNLLNKEFLWDKKLAQSCRYAEK